MYVGNKYDALLEKHRSIEAELKAEMTRPLPNTLVVQRLKRKKLLIKDEIESWERLMGAVHGRPLLRPGKLAAGT